MTPASNPLAELERSIAEPVGSSRLVDLASNRKSACIVVSDLTRPVPSQVILPIVLRELFSAGISRDRTRIVIANGLHRHLNSSEIRALVGDQAADFVQTINHDALGDSLTEVGKRPFGDDGELLVNEAVYNADVKVTIGYIEPHMEAGFTGGRKSLIPGVADAKSITAVHSPHNLDDPKSRIGVLEGNPTHEGMLAGARMVGVDFVVNVVLTPEKQIVKAYSGDMVQAHRDGVDLVRAHAEVTAEKTDLVLAACGAPLDVNLYQASKALVTAQYLAKDGGPIVLVAECPEGIGSDLSYEVMRKSDSPDEVLENCQENYRADMDMAYLVAKILKNHPVIIVSQGISKQQAETMFMKHAASPEAALETARNLVGKNATVAAVPHATQIIPP